MIYLSNINYKFLNKKSGVYLIENIVNGKVYIGSSMNLYKRLNQHRRELSNNRHTNKHLQSAWNNYKEISFKFYIIEFIENISDILNREEYYINNYECYKEELGYNILKRPSLKHEYIYSKEVKERRKGFKKGKITSEKTKKKMSEVRIGIEFSQETKEKMSKSSKVPIYMISEKGDIIRTFESAKDAGVYLNIYPTSAIYAVINGRTKSCKGYKFVRVKDFDGKKDYSFRSGDTEIYLQYDLNNNFIREWKSGKEISEFLGKKDASANISACCNGRRNKAFGFIWKHKK